MSRDSGYLKRHKSLALLVIGVVLLSYELAQNGASLDQALGRVQNWFFVTELVTDRAPALRQLTRINDQVFNEWREQTHSTTPTRGSLVDQMRLLQLPSARIEGVVTLANGERISVTRHSQPEHERYLQDKPQLKAGCVRAAKPVCKLFTLQYEGLTESIDVLLYYQFDAADPGKAAELAWRYLDPDSAEFTSVPDLRSRLIALAVPYTGKVGSAQEAYMKLREIRHKRTVRIPVVNLDVKADEAARFFSILAIILAVLMTHGLLSMNSAAVAGMDEAWLVQINQPFVRNWQGRLQMGLSLAGAMANLLIIFCPVLIVVYSYLMNPLAAPTGLLLTAFGVTLLLALAATMKFIDMLYHVYAPAMKSTD